MIYTELQTAIRGDSHREDYTTEVIKRFIAQGEALIALTLEGYFLEAAIDEDDRVVDAIYTLPSKVTLMRTVLYNNCPLDQVDETLIAQYRNIADPVAYCMRDTTLLFAGVPPTDAAFQLNYFGMPAALVADNDTNNLLNDCPQLYIEAAQVYLFKRARNLELASAMFQSVQSMIRDINRKMKKKLGGGQSANAYNVSFRSSY
jgi:hypothetical protein